jgi:hypothetical protein
VDIIGEALLVFEAYSSLLELVEEVDSCVLTLPVHRDRIGLLVGKGKSTLKAISVVSNSRIFVPEEAIKSNVNPSDDDHDLSQLFKWALPYSPSANVTFEGTFEEAKTGCLLALQHLIPAATKVVSYDFVIPGPMIGHVLGKQGSHVLDIEAKFGIEMSVEAIYPKEVKLQVNSASTSTEELKQQSKSGASVDEIEAGATVTETTVEGSNEAAPVTTAPSQPIVTLASPDAKPDGRAVRPKAESARVSLTGSIDALLCVHRWITSKIKTDGVTIGMGDAIIATVSESNQCGFLLPAIDVRTKERLMRVANSNMNMAANSNESSNPTNNASLFAYYCPSKTVQEERDLIAKLLSSFGPSSNYPTSSSTRPSHPSKQAPTSSSTPAVVTVAATSRGSAQRATGKEKDAPEAKKSASSKSTNAKSIEIRPRRRRLRKAQV